jgi:hypothetical protein
MSISTPSTETATGGHATPLTTSPNVETSLLELPTTLEKQISLPTASVATEPATNDNSPATPASAQSVFPSLSELDVTFYPSGICIWFPLSNSLGREKAGDGSQSTPMSDGKTRLMFKAVRWRWQLI